MRKSIFGAAILLFAACSSDLPHDSPFDPQTPPLKQAPGVVSGHVELENEADFSQVTVKLDGPIVDYEAQSDPSGQFAMSRVIPGSYTLTAFSRYFEPVIRDVVVGIDGGVDVGVLSLRAVRAGVSGAARAELLSNRSRVVEGGVSIRLTRARSLRSAAAAAPLEFAAAAAPAPEVGFSTVSDPDGSWRMEGVPAGVYELTAAHTGTPSQSLEEIVVGEGGDVEVADLLLRPLTGYFDIEGSDGSPLYTRVTEVTLKLLGFNASRMRLGQDTGSGCAYTRDEVYAAVVSFRLAPVEGLQTVCVRYVGDDGTQTADLLGTIEYDKTAPTLLQARIVAQDGYVTSAAAVLELAGADAGSGVAWVQWADSATGVTGAAKTAWATSLLAALPNPLVSGTKTLYLRAGDAADNATVIVPVTVVLDLAAPVLTSVDALTLDGLSTVTLTNQTRLRLDLTASDSDGTPIEMAISNRDDFLGAAWQPFAPTVYWDVAPSAAPDGELRTVYVRVRDAAGRGGNMASAAFTLDMVAPAAPPLAVDGGLEYAAAEPNYTQDSDIEVTLTPTGWAQADLSEDVSFVSVLRTVGSAAAMPVAVTFSAGNGADGLKTLYARYRDAAGNASAVVADSIYLDGTPPQFGTVVLNAGTAYAQATGLSAAVSAQETGSGLDQVELAQDNLFTFNPQTQAYTPTLSYTLGTSTNGTQTVYARFTDKAGNTSEPVSDDIVLDTLDPVVTAVAINAGAALTSNNIFTIGISATEAYPGDMMLSENAAFSGATWQPYQSPTSFAASVINGAKTVYVKMRDQAGRVSGSQSDSITLDTTPPSGLSLGFPYAVTKSASSVLSLAASDNISAFGNLKVKLTGTNLSTVDGAAGNVNTFIFLSATKTLAFTGTGVKTVTAVFQDEAGNPTLPVTTTLTIDQTGPGGTVTLLSAQGDNKSAFVSWSALAGASYYIVEYMQDYVSGAFTATGSQTFTAASGTVAGLTNGKNYGFRVRSYDAVGNADAGYSNILVASVGMTARPINQQGQTNRIRAMAVDGNTIYVLGSDTDGYLELFKTVDNGGAWSRTVLANVYVYDYQSAVLNVNNGNVLIVAQSYTGSGTTVFSSRDGGATFARYSLALFDGFAYNVASDVGIAVDGENVVLSGYDFSSPNYLLKTIAHYAGATTGVFGWSSAVQHFSTATNTLLHHALCNAGPHVLLAYQNATGLGGRYSHDSGYSWSARSISPYMTQSPADLKCVINARGTAFVVHTETALGGSGIVLHVGRVHEAFARFTLPQQLPNGSNATWRTPQVWTNDYNDIYVSAFDDATDTLWLMRARNSYTQWTFTRIDATVTAGLHHALAGSGYEDVRIAYDINDRETLQLWTPALPAPGRFDVKLGTSTVTVSPSWSAPAGIADFSVFSDWSSVPPAAAETRWSGESLSTAFTGTHNAVASRDGQSYGNLSSPYYAYPGSLPDWMDIAMTQYDTEMFQDWMSGYTYIVADEFNSVSLLRIYDDGTNDGAYQNVATLGGQVLGVDVAAWQNEVYVVYCNNADGIFLKKSVDYGATFGTAIPILDAYGWAGYGSACAIDVAHPADVTYVRIAFNSNSTGSDELHVARSNNAATSFFLPLVVDAPSSPSLGKVDIAIDSNDYSDSVVGAYWIDMGDYTSFYSTNNDWTSIYYPSANRSDSAVKVDVSDGTMYALTSSYWSGTYFAQGPLNASYIAAGRIDVNGGQVALMAKGAKALQAVYTINDTTIKYATCLENCTQSAAWVRATVQQDPNALGPLAASFSEDWGVFLANPYTQGGTYLRSNMIMQPDTSTPAIATGGLQGSYYNGTTFGVRYGSRVDTTLTQSWTGTVFSPLSDNFSVAWGGWFYVTTADYYRFQAVVDGGVRISMAGQLLLDQWTPAAATYTSVYTALLQPGWYPFTVLFNDTTGTASIDVTWGRWNNAVPTAFVAIPTTSLGH